MNNIKDMLKKSVDTHNSTIKNFKPAPAKSPEVMALESISWHLKRIADVLEKKL